MNDYTKEYLEKTQENFKEYKSVYGILDQHNHFNVISTKYNYTFSNKNSNSNKLKNILENQKKLYVFITKYLQQ